MLLESGFMELGKEDGEVEQRAQQREAEPVSCCLWIKV